MLPGDPGIIPGGDRMGGIISVKVKDGWKKTERFFHRTLKKEYMKVLEEYAEEGVAALREATPKDSGDTANAWGYKIESREGVTKLYFTNDHVQNGMNIAILLIYGHGTRNGGYVQGNDFVTPALEPIFQDLADTMFREIMK